MNEDGEQYQQHSKKIYTILRCSVDDDCCHSVHLIPAGIEEYHQHQHRHHERGRPA